MFPLLAALTLGLLLGLGVAQFLGLGGSEREQPEVLARGTKPADVPVASTPAPPTAAAGVAQIPQETASARAPVAEVEGAANTDDGLVRLVRTLVAMPAFVTNYGADAEALLELAFDLELRLRGATRAVALLDAPDTPSGLLRRGAAALEAELGIAHAAPLLRRLVDRQVDVWLGRGAASVEVEDDAAWGTDAEGAPFEFRFGAAEEAVLSMESWGSDWSRYALADPAGALALARDLFGRAGPQMRQEFGALFAQQLQTMGLEAEAATVLQTLLTEQPDRGDLLAQLAGLDPNAAEARIRSRLATSEPGEAEHLRGMLAGLLARQGRTSEALALVRAGLPEGLNGEALEWALAENAELAQALTVEEMRDWLGAPPSSPALVHHIVERHVDEGDFDAAVGAWAAVVDRVTAGEDPGWLPSLPERLAQERGPELRALAQRLEALSTENDEVLGDLGDLWVLLGDHEAALRTYTRAANLDPSDSEWTNALRNTRARLGGR